MFFKGFVHHAFRNEQDPVEKDVHKYRKHDQWLGGECTQKQIMNFHLKNIFKTHKNTHLNSIPFNTRSFKGGGPPLQSTAGDQKANRSLCKLAKVKEKKLEEEDS